MLEFHVVTIFPELFASFLGTSLMGKAIERGLLAVRLVDLRDFTSDRHRTVDDAPYGGGSGMVMKPAPILAALSSLPPAHRVLLSPQGQVLTQATVRRLAGQGSIALFCGRYEGVDERVRSRFDEELSLGDFVLNGGEVAAMAVVEAVSRLVPGVLGNEASTVEESHTAGLLEYPQYTRPEALGEERVPAVLLSGDHARVARWRRAQSLLRTRTRRPDLFHRLLLSPEDERLLRVLEEGGEP